jgi:uridine kinase
MLQTKLSDFSLVSPRAEVEILLPDGRVISGPRGAAVWDFLQILPEAHNPQIVGAIVNGELRELTYPIQMDSNVFPVAMDSEDGMRIYRRSLIFLLETAFLRQFPGAKLNVDHSIGFGGYYCRVFNHSQLSTDDLASLEIDMRKLVSADLPFVRKIVSLETALEIFRQENEDDKLSLLYHRQKNYVTLYELDGHSDYHHGYMLPSTGYIQWFALTWVEDGFILHFPRRNAPTELAPLPIYPKLLSTFREYGDWLSRLGISSVGALNTAIKNNRVHEVVLVSEALHEQRVSEIASQIAESKQKIRVILIAGPSSSGKTTFSKRLSIQLLAYGLSPFPLEMDNYFHDRDNTPLNDRGESDFESINALDLDQLSTDLHQLIHGAQVRLPRFNFISGKREPGEEIQLTTSDIIIIEGIHGLNPGLLHNSPAAHTYRVYASALTQLNLDRHNRVSTTDTRLLRRIVRDANQRGYNAQQTIQRWESVRAGERKYIFPYQENADVMFNSALVYEVSVLKPLVEPLLRQVPFGTPEHVEAKRLLAFLEWFLPIDLDLVPDNSILREFIGGSILRNFAIWQNHHGLPS